MMDWRKIFGGDKKTNTANTQKSDSWLLLLISVALAVLVLPLLT
jgi:hypothetical protein